VAQSVTGAVVANANQVLLQDTGMQPPIGLSTTDVYGAGARYIDTSAPGVIALTVLMVTFMLSIISFVHERSTGTLDRVLTTNATEGEILLGHALAFSVFGLVQSIVVLVAAWVLFGVMINGSVLLILLLLFLLGLVMQGMGLLFSATARTEFEAIQYLPLVLFPSIFLCGVFWPLESVPQLLQPISYLVPLTYAVDGLQSVMVRGWGLDHVGWDCILLVVYAAIMLLLSWLVLRRRR
jgi:ABC-2 type transport system permease protein